MQKKDEDMSNLLPAKYVLRKSEDKKKSLHARSGLCSAMKYLPVLFSMLRP